MDTIAPEYVYTTSSPSRTRLMMDEIAGHTFGFVKRRDRTVKDSEAYKAICRCGWKADGKWRGSKSLARRMDFLRHIGEAAKQGRLSL